MADARTMSYLRGMKRSDWQVAVVGAGRLAWSLIPNLQRRGVAVRQLIARNPATGRRFQQAYDLPKLSRTVSELDPAVNMVFLAVSDGAIAPLAAELAQQVSADTLVLHCSGSMPLSALEALGDRGGVFYPLQIFTFESVSEFGQVPLFLEGDDALYARVLPLAQSLSARVSRLDSPARERLHLGAVWACNFSNYLYQVAETFAPGEDFSVYEALLRTQLEKVLRDGPSRSQTGPAARGDEATLQRHAALLAEEPELQGLYKRLSEGIIQEVRLKNDPKGKN